MIAAIDGLWLTDQIDDIVVGKTGYCYILGTSGTIIADSDARLVENMFKSIEEVKKDPTLVSVADTEKKALEAAIPSIYFFQYKSIAHIASYSKIKTTGWTAGIIAPVGEFMGTVDELRNRMLIIGAVILVTALAITF